MLQIVFTVVVTYSLALPTHPECRCPVLFGGYDPIRAPFHAKQTATRVFWATVSEILKVEKYAASSQPVFRYYYIVNIHRRMLAHRGRMCNDDRKFILWSQESGNCDGPVLQKNVAYFFAINFIGFTGKISRCGVSLEPDFFFLSLSPQRCLLTR